MDVREFLHQNRMQLQELAEKSGVNKHTLSSLKSEKRTASFSVATKLVKATNFHIGYSDLMPDVYASMIKEYKSKVTEVKNGNEN